MEFLDISSLGTAYQYTVKIEHKFKQKKRDFGYANPKQGKGAPKPKMKDQPKRLVVYESRTHSVINTFTNKLYKIPEVAPPTAISLITAKKCSKIISQTKKFVFLMIHLQSKNKVLATASRHGSSSQQQKMDKVVEEYRYIFTSPIGVPLHCQVKHSIDLTLCAPLPNGPIYRFSLLENDEIKRQI
eukprot:PITA_12393